MNSMNFLNAFMSSGIPHQVMNLFKRRKRNKGMLLFSIIGLVISTMAIGMKRSNTISNPLKNMNPTIDKIQNAFTGSPKNAFAEFAQEFSMKNLMGKDALSQVLGESNDVVHHYTNKVSPENKNLLEQFAKVDDLGSKEAIENLSEAFIEQNAPNKKDF